MQEYMPQMTLKNIALACNGTYVGNPQKEGDLIAGAVTDSRLVNKDDLFIAVKGERVDGHKFIPEVFEKGALAVLSEVELDAPAGPYILVDSCLEAMKKIAAFYRSTLQIPVVGITGSVGKTSTKEMIASVLEEKYRVLKTAGNYNNEIGLPLTIFRIRPSHEVAVLEMGISDFGEMHRLAEMARPNLGVITNIGWCHLENLKTRDGILAAKTEMFDHLFEDGIAILNGDDDKLCTKEVVNGTKPIFYGIPEKYSQAAVGNGTPSANEKELSAAETSHVNNPVIYASDVKNLGFDGMRATIHTPEGAFEAKISIPGEHNVYNALAATAVGLQLGLRISEIQNGIAKAQTIAGRTNLLKVNDMTIIDDCYNANPVSMKASIEVLSHAQGRSIAVLGDMGELGEDERRLHHDVGVFVGEQKIDMLFCAGELAVEYEKGARERNSQCEIFYFQTREQMTAALQSYVKAGDTILVKASHFMEFPKVVEALSAQENTLPE